MNFYARPETLARLTHPSPPKVALAGGFNGNWNFGDLMQLLGTIRWHRNRNGRTLILPLIHFNAVPRRQVLKELERLFQVDDWILYAPEASNPTPDQCAVLGLIPVAPSAVQGALSLHVYGGGFFNRLWGTRMLGLIEALLAQFPVGDYVLSGQQVGPEFAETLGRHLRSHRPRLVGCRDPLSVAALEGQGIHVGLSGDDAFEELARYRAEEADASLPVKSPTGFGIHLSLADYVGHEAPDTTNGVGDAEEVEEPGWVLRLLLDRFGTDGEPLVIGANLDPQAPPPDSWASLAPTLLPSFFPRFRGIDLVGSFLQGKLPEAAAAVHATELVVAHSYHVTLFAQVLGVPAYLVALNDYYEQKRQGLSAGDGTLEGFLKTPRGEILERQEEHLERMRALRRMWLDELGAALGDTGRGGADVPASRPGRHVPPRAEPRSGPDSVYRAGNLPLALPEGPVINPQDWRARYHGQELRVRQLEAELNLVRGSRSWRWTQPLRTVYPHLWRVYAGTVLRAIRLVMRKVAEPTTQAQEPARDWVARRGRSRAESSILPQPPWDLRLPLVSVVIPCYNYGRFLPEALDSVHGQTLQDFEIIVVDDGSTDPFTRRVLEDLEGSKTRVLHQTNTGLPGARNSGIRQARGKYICCLDADDTLAPTYLEKAACLLEARPDVGFAYSWVQRFGDKDGVWHTEPFSLENLLQYNHVSVSAVFRRSAWKGVGGYWDRMRPGYEDWEFWIRLGAAGSSGALIPEPLLNHRKHGRTMVDEAAERHAELSAKIRSRHARLYRKPALAVSIARRYKDRQAAQPFRNLARPSQYRVSDIDQASRLLVLRSEPPLGLMPGAALMAMDLGMEHPREVHDIVAFSEEAPEPPSPGHTPLHSYRLPDFLPDYAWPEFISNYVRTRGIGLVVTTDSWLSRLLLPRLKHENSDLRSALVLPAVASSSETSDLVFRAATFDLVLTETEELGRRLVEGGIPPGIVHTIPHESPA